MSITPEDELCHYCHLVDSHERVRGRREMDTHTHTHTQTRLVIVHTHPGVAIFCKTT